MTTKPTPEYILAQTTYFVNGAAWSYGYESGCTLAAFLVESRTSDNYWRALYARKAAAFPFKRTPGLLQRHVSEFRAGLAAALETNGIPLAELRRKAPMPF